VKDLLIPRPQMCRERRGCFKPASGARILLPPGEEGRHRLLVAAQPLKDAMREELGVAIDIGVAFGEGPQPAGAIELRIGREGPAQPESYRLSVRPDGATATAREARGLCHALATLRQLARLGGPGGLPCVEIEDWPVLEVRGYMLDISRGKVPTLQTLFGIVDDLAALKYNSFQLYCEHTFAYKRHPQIGAANSPMTAEEIVRLDQYCHERNIELVPNLQSFGHQHHILKLPAYKHLAESDHRGGWTLSPARRATYELLADMYAEYLPLFRSKQLNISCDETYDLGQGLTKRRARRVGVGRVYLDHILRLRKLAERHGKRIMMWGDIVQKHPDIVPLIPKDILMLDWFYNQPTPKAARARSAGNRLFREAGLDTLVCPGTNTYITLACRAEVARSNIRWFANLGRQNGARGMLLTEWGDHGHMNLLGSSRYPVAIGADAAWHGGMKDSAQFDRAFSRILYSDKKGRTARAILLLDRAQQQHWERGRWPNWFDGPRAFLFGEIGRQQTLKPAPAALASIVKTEPRAIEKALGEARQARDLLVAARAGAPRGVLDLDELIYSADTMIHAYRRARLACALAGTAPLPAGLRPKAECAALAKDANRLAAEFKRLWLARSKPSDLAENLARYRRIIGAYGRWSKGKG